MISLDSEKALNQLIKIKNRDIDSGKIFTLVPELDSAGHISAEKYAIIPEAASVMIKTQLPGPLTFVLNRAETFRHPYYDHFKTIGLRVPDTPLFRELLPLSGPLILTSANRRGAAPLQTAAAILSEFSELDGLVQGEANNEPPSTVIDFTGETPKILRQGAIKVV